MEIIKTGVRSDLDFSKMSLAEIKEYWESLEGDSLHMVLPSYLNLSYLCEVRDDINIRRENIKKKEVPYIVQFEKLFNTKPDFHWKNEEWDVLDWGSLSEQEKAMIIFKEQWGGYFWLVDPGWEIIVYNDFTLINNSFSGDPEERERVDIYSTSEVLHVIDQWIEYLEKFNAEKEK